MPPIVASPLDYLDWIANAAFGFQLLWIAVLTTIHSTFSSSIPAVIRDLLVPAYVGVRLWGRRLFQMVKLKSNGPGRFALEGGVIIFVSVLVWNVGVEFKDIDRTAASSYRPMMAIQEVVLKADTPRFVQSAPPPNPVSSSYHDLRLTFTDSPLLTIVRRQRISGEISRFHDYLVAIGLDPPSDVPPIGTASVYQVSGVFPGPPYMVSIRLPENRLDDSETAIAGYSQYCFPFMIDAYDVTRKDMARLIVGAMIFRMYFMASYENKRPPKETSQLLRWGSLGDSPGVRFSVYRDHPRSWIRERVRGHFRASPHTTDRKGEKRGQGPVAIPA